MHDRVLSFVIHLLRKITVRYGPVKNFRTSLFGENGKVELDIVLVELWTLDWGF